MATRRLFTGRGDAGETDLLGARVGKDDPRIETLGDLDETTSAIGLGRALAETAGSGEILVQVQRDLYTLMAELAFTDAVRPADMGLSGERVAWLETVTDDLTARVTIPRAFVLPGGTPAGAALDVARTVARRAERRAVALAHAGQVKNPEILRYLNRLSSLLFVLARAEDAAAGKQSPRAKAETRVER